MCGLNFIALKCLTAWKGTSSIPSSTANISHKLFLLTCLQSEQALRNRRRDLGKGWYKKGNLQWDHSWWQQPSFVKQRPRAWLQCNLTTAFRWLLEQNSG